MTDEEIEKILKRKLTEARSLTVDLSKTCTLECSACMREIYRRKGVEYMSDSHNLSIESFDRLSSWYDEFSFCGQISDPIFNPNLEYFLKECYKKKIEVGVNTAATSKKIKEEDYDRLFKANPEARWIFGIDGLGEDSEWYRVNQDSRFLWEMMMKCRKDYPERRIIWQFILFSFNEDYIEEARQIAKENNLVFKSIVSGRHYIKAFIPKNKEYVSDYVVSP